MSETPSEFPHPFVVHDFPDDRSQTNFQRIIEVLKNRFDLENFLEISVSFVDPEEMQELNKNYRDKDEATDILTFLVPASDNMPNLGDIYLCSECLKDDWELGDPDLILGFMFTHGVLHLLGYTHETEEKLMAMVHLQKEIVGKEIAR